MFKIKYMAFLCAALLLLTGCARRDDFGDGFASEFTPAEAVTAKTEFPEYDGNVEEIKLIITNDGSEEWDYNVVFHLEKYDEDMGGWRNIKFSDKMTWTLLACGISPSETVTVPIPLKGNYKQPLLPGQYRVVKHGSNYNEAISAEFKIK